MGVSDFLFTAIVVAVVDAEVEDTVVVGVEVGLVAVIGFIVADTGFTARISALSGVLSFDLNTKEEHLLLVFFFLATDFNNFTIFFSADGYPS